MYIFIALEYIKFLVKIHMVGSNQLIFFPESSVFLDSHHLEKYQKTNLMLYSAEITRCTFEQLNYSFNFKFTKP